MSAESYSGRQNVGYLGEAYDRFAGFVEALESIQKYRAVRIVLFFRKHDDWLRSGYLHQVRMGTGKTFDSHVASFSESDLNWSARAKLLSQFDARFYDYEDFRADPEAVIRDMCLFWRVKFPFGKRLPSAHVNSAPATVAGLRFQWAHSRMRRILLGEIARPYRTSRLDQNFDDRAKTFGFKGIGKLTETLNLPNFIRLRAVDDWEKLKPFLRKVSRPTINAPLVD